MICSGTKTGIAIVLSLSFLTVCFPFNIHILQSPSQLLRNGNVVRSGTGGGGLHLFDTTLQNKANKSRNNNSQPFGSAYPRRVSDAELDFMRGGFGVESASSPPPPFPYTVKWMFPTQPTVESTDIQDANDNSQLHKLIIRHLEEEDILRIMPEIVREFGSLAKPPARREQQYSIPNIPNTSASSSSPSSSSTAAAAASLNAQGDGVASQIENFLFSFTVLFGLTQRVARRKEGYSSSANRECRPDHNVICLVEQRIVRQDDSSGNINSSNNNSHGVEEGTGQISYMVEEIVGIAELSWQPPIPNRNAPPYVLPYAIKMLISRFFSPPSARGSNDDNTTILGPKGYISNVLVWKNRRGHGYAHVLMAALEGIAKLWGCTDVRLHVDANEQSGKIAQLLYGSLGYVGVPDRGTTKADRVGFEWMGPSMAHEGLYMVDGLPLLYLRKCL